MPLDVPATAIDYGAGIRATPSGAALGADITGLDLAQPLDAEQVAALRRAWADHLVLRFRGQTLDDAALMAFSANFGTLDRAPVPAAKRVGVDEATRGYVLLISNIIEDGKPIGGLGYGEAVWHSDMSYKDEPPVGSVLYGVEVPPAGGNTGFCNMALAYATLPEDLKARVATLTCKHDSSHNSAGELRRGFQEATDPRDAPGAIHPMVIRHPDSGKPCLFLGRRANAHIPGLELAESEALLDRLWAHATRPEFTWAQEWRVGDVVMWNNFGTMHRRDPFEASSRRLMRRTQIAGVPYGRM